jgi:predicted molibdopterin-dependent oxidoreductase YjgC
VTKNDPFFDHDDNLCILCGRCIRACENLHFASTLAYTKRGTHALVGTSFYRTHLESSCTFCGACVEKCPTGALSEKTRKWDGKPERHTASTCALCSVSCQINLLSKNERIIGSLPNHSAGEESLCVKGRFGITELVNHPTRLKHPQKRIGHTWLGVDWEEAVRAAAEKLANCPSERFEMHISTSCTNEDLYVAAKFTSEVMKSVNIRTKVQPSQGAGIMESAWLLKQSQPMEILRNTPLVFCLGFEDKYTQSVVEVQLRRAKEQGVKIITLGERQLPWSGHADEWLQAEPGQTAELLQKLVEMCSPNDDVGEESSALARSAGLLWQSDMPVVLLGPAALTDSKVLQSIAALSYKIDAQFITLPDQTNLNGALWLDMLGGELAETGQELDVLYLIGERVPNKISGQPFILYQNIYPPSDDSSVDLMLPATAFTEEEGTFLDYASRVRAIYPAVRPAGEALPDWLILSRIAQAMGAQNFEYNSVEDIRAEISGLADALANGCPVVWPAREPALHPIPPDNAEVDPADAHLYMGFPLEQWVEGLHALYPKKYLGDQSR